MQGVQIFHKRPSPPSVESEVSHVSFCPVCNTKDNQSDPHAIEANVNRFLRIFQTIILFVLTRDALFPLFDVVFMKGFLESHKHQCVSNLGILTLFK